MAVMKDESELKETLRRDVEECGKEKIVVQAGHFPLLYLPGGVAEGINRWGPFSPYTLELGCGAAKVARDLGKDVKFVFFADDHGYQHMAGNLRRAKSSRRGLYRLRSGESAQLNQVYRKIMEGFGFSEDDVLRHDQGKNGREDCLYFSELILRNSGRNIENACAREYIAFLENPRYFDMENSHLVSFVPNRCIGAVCDVALDEEIEGLSASHVFMETMNPFSSRGELYTQGRGVTYRRDR